MLRLVSGDELTAARNAFNGARANLKAGEAAHAQAAANRTTAIGDRDADQALIADTTVETNPEVLAAQAEFDQARVNLERMVICAPVNGIASKRAYKSGSGSSQDRR